MLGLGTNVLVRLLVADDADQTRRARALVERAVEREEPVLVFLPVIIETEWVLRSLYALDKEAILASLGGLIATRELTLEDEPVLEEAFYRWRDSAAGFVDCLIVTHNRRLGCSATATFAAAATRVPGFVAAKRGNRRALPRRPSPARIRALFRFPQGRPR